jgi:hypothetical protein
VIVARGLGRDTDVIGTLVAFGLGLRVLQEVPQPQYTGFYTAPMPRRRTLELLDVGGLELVLRMGGLRATLNEDDIQFLLMASENILE